MIAHGVIARLVFLIGLLLAFAAQAQPCDPCTLPNGAYRAIPPPGWDGKRALPLLMFVHGWQSDAKSTLADDDVTGPAARQGFLLIVPEGLNKAWHFRGTGREGRDDLGFLRVVLADAAAHFPVDRTLVAAAGFSIGASMVWDLACHAASGITAFLPLSGGFWEPMPTQCEAGPVNLRQTHGLADPTFPLSGRPIGRNMRQGDVRRGLAILRAADACTDNPEPIREAGDLTCETWKSCAGGRRLQLCLHAGGHMIEAAHLEAGLRWARGLAAR